MSRLHTSILLMVGLGALFATGACITDGGVGDDDDDAADDDDSVGDDDDSAGDDDDSAGDDDDSAGDDDDSAAWPAIDNYSASDDKRVQALVEAAIEGLGFAESETGPQPQDRFFAGRQYLAWIDQTGFYGKMNGLWRLNGASGDELDFVVEEEGRPVNFFVPGENGDGGWPPGYPGAEHIEFPNRTPEANDNPDCALSDWCNQYAHNEAPLITDPDIPWWSSCNGGDPAWTDVFTPIIEEAVPGGLRLVYEGPLAKEADGDGTWDSDQCHEDWLFADGVRRPVFLRVGYELFGDEPHFDRVMQFRNPAGNPEFEGPMSLIGGFVITTYPAPHPLKEIHRWLRPEAGDVWDNGHGITLAGGQFNAHDLTPTSGDEVWGWLGQPFTMSALDGYAPGRTATLSHIGASDNGDVGVCLCVVHGGIEMGGGLLHGGISLPVAAGTTSIEARRRLALAGEEERTYEAEVDLSHQIGSADVDGWSASLVVDEPGHLAFGPYADDWGGISATAVFHLMVDDNTADNLDVVTLDIYDATADEVLAVRAVTRAEFSTTMTYQPFSLGADLSGRTGNVLEARVFWHDVTYVRFDKVVVTTAG